MIHESIASTKAKCRVLGLLGLLRICDGQGSSFWLSLRGSSNGRSCVHLPPPPPGGVGHTTKLSTADMGRNLAVLAGVPYPQRKLDEASGIEALGALHFCNYSTWRAHPGICVPRRPILP
jgi:hypothetical protein